MSSLKNFGLEFDETMSGWLGLGKTDHVEGRIAGQQENTPIRIDAKIIIDDLDRFLNLAQHRARLEGSVTFKPLGAPSPWRTAPLISFKWNPPKAFAR